MKSIRTKILTVFSLILLFLIGISVLGYTGVSQLESEVERIMANDYEMVSRASALSDNTAQRVIIARGFVLYGDPKYKQSFLEETKKSDELMKSFQELSGNTPEFLDAKQKTEKWNALILDQVIPAYEKGGFAAAIPIMEKYCQPWSMDAINAWQAQKSKADTALKDTQKVLQDNVQNQQRRFIFIASVATALGITLSVTISHRIINPIQSVVGRLSQIAKHDLTGEPLVVKTKDELNTLSTAVNEVTDNLRDIVTNLQKTDGQLHETSSSLVEHNEKLTVQTQEVVGSVTQVAVGSETQAHGAVETSAAMDNVTKRVQMIADSSANVYEKTQDVGKDATEGNQLVQGTIEQMNVISTSVHSAANVLDDLGQQSAEIGHITEVINAIAVQTNLLALNAAIEAARAGEHGQGFAIVADEVRKLAEQSKASAEQISNLIKKVQLGTNRAIEFANASKQEVDHGKVVVDEAGKAFTRIIQSIEDITNQIEEVSASTQEISAAVEEVSASVVELSTIAHQNVTYSQQVKESSEIQSISIADVGATVHTLNQMSEELRSIMKKFTL